MAFYGLGDAQVTPSRVSDYATWTGGFTSEELDKIVEIGSKLVVDKATLGGVDIEDDFNEIRKSKTGWIELNPETAWIYDRLAFIARSLNTLNWQFDLVGFSETLQFTVYEDDESHYTWHQDTIKDFEGTSHVRKLSLVIQLTDPSEYEGGDLQFKTGPGDITIQKERGLVTVFPSFNLHRVTPVTKGTRKSLVVWISGPPFK